MWTGLFLLTFVCAQAQVTPKHVSFEVASIRLSTDQADPAFTSGIQIQGQSVVVRRASMRMLIRAAYGLRARFVVGPAWIESEPLFDVRATVPSNSSSRMIPEMFQSLLKDRFGLEFHFEQRDKSAYALVLADGGPRMQPSSGGDDSMPGGAVSGINWLSNLLG
jgi:uncharacterized protein (TIGR03435 family)